MTLALSTAAKIGGVNGVRAIWNGGSAAATGSIEYTSATSQVLATQVMPTLFPAADGAGQSQITNIPTTTVSAAGTSTVTGYRYKDRDGAIQGTGTVTANGGGGDITFDNVQWSQNGTVNMPSFTLTAN